MSSSSTASPPTLGTCAVCNQALGSQPGRCPNCSASEEWQELADAFAFVRRRFEEWHDGGRISLGQLGKLQEHYNQGKSRMLEAVHKGVPAWQGVGLPRPTKCYSCKEEADERDARCPSCGVILQSPAVRSLRYWNLLLREIGNHQEAGRLSLVQAHELDAEVRERMASLRGRLELDG